MAVTYYSDLDKLKIVRDVPIFADELNESLENVAEKRFNISRQTYYKYKKEVNYLLKGAGKKLTDLPNMNDDDLKNMLDHKEKKYDKPVKNNLLNNLYSELNKKVEVKKEDEVIELDTTVENNEDKEVKKSFNLSKWILIGGIGLIVVVVIMFFVRKFKNKNVEVKEEKESTKKDKEVAEEFPEFGV